MNNGFTIYDRDFERFQDNDGLLIDKNGKIFNSIGQELDKEIYEVFCDTGLKDIDNKKIYADCSIVEFRCKIWGNSINTNKGYFQFNNTTLRYVIVSMCGRTISYDIDYISDLKAIDTIQENKLGLIK